MPDPNTPAPRAGEPARITCSCPVCGAMTLPADSFDLVVCASDAGRSFYQFTCPKCSGLVTKQASERVVTGLSARGVRVTSMPLEALEAHGGPVLTMDDLLDLSLALSKSDAVAATLSATS
ncbi:hypothetical protein SAMN06264364_1465 [Quadrisphaera granulorum]|uniref:Uncharacterized protein n=1 Tax=Quadrisphaera granulorum TaxID=317664 RepID=A0A315ZML6_9ACTN|nr:hypothetical protein [Quadrisphaera granulorum]PWJ46479.1 hypothetical protein BXY45_1465 [Quadrisphaera granulorum]SZE99037.1 hypothetical protein SAMN06264364_1465 [Quadrisphaera granulorum]